MVYKISMLIILVVVVSLAIYAKVTVQKLQNEYQDDERWLQIKLMAGNATKRYFEYVLILVALIQVVLLFSNSLVMVRLDRVASVALLLIIFGHVVEYLVIMHFDKYM